RVLPNGQVEEWERTPTIPDDFIYDPVTHSYSAPGEPTEWNAEVYEENVRRYLEERAGAPPTPEEQQPVPAGTLGGTAKRRKSRSGGPKQQLGLFDDEDTVTAEQESPADDDAE